MAHKQILIKRCSTPTRIMLKPVFIAYQNILSFYNPLTQRAQSAKFICLSIPNRRVVIQMNGKRKKKHKNSISNSFCVLTILIHSHHVWHNNNEMKSLLRAFEVIISCVDKLKNKHTYCPTTQMFWLMPETNKQQLSCNYVAVLLAQRNANNKKNIGMRSRGIENKTVAM